MFRSRGSVTASLSSLLDFIQRPLLSPPLLAFSLLDPLGSIRHTFCLSPAPWSVAALYTCFRPCGVDPDLGLTGFGIGVFLTVGWFLVFLVGVSVQFIGKGSSRFF